MRFTVALVGAFAAIVSAQSTTSSAATSTNSVDAAQASTLACLEECDGDSTCMSYCGAPVPSPDEDAVNNNIACLAECPQGNGTEEQTARYIACKDACEREFFFVSESGTPRPTGAAGGSNNGSDDEENSSSGSNNSAVTTVSQSGSAVTAVTSGTATSTSTDPAETGSEDGNDSAANSLSGSSAVALFGLIAAALAM
jgi:phosphotransferase system  glucose/maltose/N-acetylglucosamine-specific IIC component